MIRGKRRESVIEDGHTRRKLALSDELVDGIKDIDLKSLVVVVFLGLLRRFSVVSCVLRSQSLQQDHHLLIRQSVTHAPVLGACFPPSHSVNQSINQPHIHEKRE